MGNGYKVLLVDLVAALQELLPGYFILLPYQLEAGMEKLLGVRVASNTKQVRWNRNTLSSKRCFQKTELCELKLRTQHTHLAGQVELLGWTLLQIVGDLLDVQFSQWTGSEFWRGEDLFM